MALRPAVSDREMAKFVEKDGKHVVQVTGIESFSPPPETDAITASYPDAITEIYEYRQGGIAGAILKTVTVVYVDSTKESLTSVVVV